MKFVPNAVSRVAHRSILKASKNSPTILVVAGVVGLGATAVLASKATLKLEEITSEHAKSRIELKYAELSQKDEQRAVLDLYFNTGVRLAKLYGPTLIVGGLSVISVLGGHKILRGRYVATVAAYSGLFDQFNAYRGRVAKALGADKERALYDGAKLEWKEDPDHKGEFKLEPVYDETLDTDSYLRPIFDEGNTNWTRDPLVSYGFLKGVQAHMNNLLDIRGHVFLNEVYDALAMPRHPAGAVTGWLKNGEGDGFVDFGFMASKDPNTIAFANGLEKRVRLNFNIDGEIWKKI